MLFRQKISKFFRENDPSRLVHYEGVFHCREFDRISDVESRMYAPPEEIRRYLEGKPKKPFILCEYMHNMGHGGEGQGPFCPLIGRVVGRPLCRGGVPVPHLLHGGHTAPALPGLKTDVAYTVEDTGCITAAAHYHGGAGQPKTPPFFRSG